MAVLNNSTRRQKQTDWDLESGVLSIANKPDIPAPFSGVYSDLTGKPALFSGAYSDLTGKPSLFSGDYEDLTNKPFHPVAPGTPQQLAMYTTGGSVLVNSNIGQNNNGGLRVGIGSQPFGFEGIPMLSVQGKTITDDLYVNGNAKLWRGGAAVNIATLDDIYAEGSFTVASPAVSIVTQTCRYAKVGKMVFCVLNVSIPSNESSDSFALTGLPFVSSAVWPVSASSPFPLEGGLAMTMLTEPGTNELNSEMGVYGGGVATNTLSLYTLHLTLTYVTN